MGMFGLNRTHIFGIAFIVSTYMWFGGIPDLETFMVAFWPEISSATFIILFVEVFAPKMDKIF